MIEQALLDTFNSNFVAYYKAHAAHANVTGRNFISDHKLLGDIYEDLQAQIDVLGELLRTIKVKMPYNISSIIGDSRVYDDAVLSNHLTAIEEDLETLVDVYTTLYEVAGNEYSHIANYAQDRLLALHKFIWMLDATTGDTDD